MFRTDLLSIIRSLDTVYTGRGICHYLLFTIYYVECLLARSESCVFKVKYDGTEIPCDYTEPVLSRYV